MFLAANALLLAVGAWTISLTYTKATITRRSLIMPLESDNTQVNIEDFLAEKPTLAIYAGPQSTTAVAGSEVVLECETSLGQPAAIITWLHDGQTLYTPESDILERSMNLGMKTLSKSSTKSRVTLPCVTASDAGTYICLASNGHQIAMANASVTVTGSASDACAIQREERRVTAPVIYMWTADRLEREGANVQVFCRARGHPTPRIQWYRTTDVSTEYTLIDPTTDPMFEYLMNGDLLIKAPQAKSLGVGHMLKCVASNQAGSDEAETFLFITSAKGDLLFQR